MKETPKFIAYGGEKSRTRFWQDAHLTALGALIASFPPNWNEIGSAPDGVVDYATRVNLAAGAIADVADRQHGPSVSERLQSERPFVGVKLTPAEALRRRAEEHDEDEEPRSYDPESDGY